MDDPYPKPLPPAPMYAPGQVSDQRTFYCSSCGNHLGSSQIGGSCSSCGAPVSGSLERSNLPTPGSAIASLVLGIASIVTCILWGIPAVICGILAVIFAGMAERKVRAGAFGHQSLGMITAGRVCGWIGISLGSLFTLGMVGYWVLLFVFFASAANNPNWPPPPHGPGQHYNTPQPVTPNATLSPTPGAPSTIENVEEESSEDPVDPAPDAPELEDVPAPPEAVDGASP